jgi:hypothetical protein
MTMVRTAMGKLIDMDAIVKKNEETLAVSNIPMNARGDRLDTTGRVRVPVSTVARVQREAIEPEVAMPISETNTIKKQTRKKKEKPRVVSERVQQDINGNEYTEIEYDDGSIEIKNAK